MLVPIRKTQNGTEYWDRENKKSVFVPRGKEPEFKVSDNKGEMIGDYTLSREVRTEEKRVEKVEEVEQGERKSTLDFNEMTIKELRDYAKKKEIDIPSDAKTKGDIIEFLSDVK